MTKTFMLALIALLFAGTGTAAERTSRFEVETGLLNTLNMEIRGFQQPNATEGWKKSAPALRLEYWLVKPDSWDYGIVYQPLSLSYAGDISGDLDAKGKHFRKGSPATLNYQFPTLRFTGNFPILKAKDGDYIRLGASLLIRYARVELRTSNLGLNDANLIVLPIPNIELRKTLGHGWSVLSRADFLPAINGSTLLDGLFDVFAGVRRDLKAGAGLDLGIRLFFGGYDPAKRDDYANRIFFNSVVVRYSW